MKKLIRNLLFLAIVLVSFQTVCFAKVGDVIGTAQHTSIVAYINDYAIPSYAVNGQSCIVAEDLANYGFNVRWDGEAMALYITRSDSFYVKGKKFSKTGESGSKFADILETEVKVFANDTQLTSFAINGYTMIPMEELTMFGDVQWVPDEAALKMWVDNLNCRKKKQYVEPYLTVNDEYYPGTFVPNYTFVTGIPLKEIGIDEDAKGIFANFKYGFKKRGEDLKMAEYMDYLINHGWKQKDYEYDSDKEITYFVKNSKALGVIYVSISDEVWIGMFM